MQSNMQQNSQHVLPGIKCDVTNCVYNNHKHECTAKEIKVGPQYANSSEDTVCDTFRP